MHDIGKVVIPDTVILKKTALSRGERQIIETHAATGAELLARAKLPYARLAEEVARYHHEYWDGRGYPEGLSGNAIPLSARIVGLCDAFDAMVHDRVYRRANTPEEALGQIAKESERQFDPHLVDLFIPLVRRVYAQHADVNAFLTQAAQATSLSTAIRSVEERASRDSPGDANEQVRQQQQTKLDDSPLPDKTFMSEEKKNGARRRRDSAEISRGFWRPLPVPQMRYAGIWDVSGRGSVAL